MVERPRPSSPSAPAQALELLGLALHEVQALDPAYPRFDAQRPLVVFAAQFAAARPLLAARYPAETEVRAVLGGRVEHVDVAALLDPAAPTGAASAWALPALAPEDDRRALAGLRGVMERLYAPDGCPWDREQTHETLRRYFLEECYELVDAIDRGDLPGLEEELGDVMAHLFMQTALAQRDGEFSLEDVVAHAAAKFVRRHPHVFGDEEAHTREQLLGRWDAIKASERAEQADGDDVPPPGALDSIPRAAPALQRAQSMIHRARRAAPGAIAAGDPRAAAAAFAAAPGDETLAALLWAAVTVADDAEIDAEETLRLAAGAFAERFAREERVARAQ